MDVVEPTATRVLIQLLLGQGAAAVLAATAQLGIAELLVEGPKGCEELAQATSTHPRSLEYLLRALVSLGILTEVAPGQYAQTQFSHLLRPDVPGSLYGYAMMHTDEWTWRVWSGLLHSLRTGETAFDHVYGTNIWHYFDQQPEVSKRFDLAMASISKALVPATAIDYDFSSIHTVVEIGGGHGDFLMTILAAWPEMHGVLLERPSVVEGAKAHIAASGLSERCTVVPGDMFETLPPGGDAYILKEVLNDWDDTAYIKVLANCRRVMQSEGRVLVVEVVNEPEKMPAMGNLITWLIGRGKTRTEQEHSALFAAAGFRLTRVIPIKASPMSILEAVQA
jgi:hypothetical protein